MQKSTAVIEEIKDTKNSDYKLMYFKAYRRADRVVVIPEKRLVLSKTVTDLTLVPGDIVEL